MQSRFCLSFENVLTDQQVSFDSLTTQLSIDELLEQSNAYVATLQTRYSDNWFFFMRITDIRTIKMAKIYVWPRNNNSDIETCRTQYLRKIASHMALLSSMYRRYNNEVAQIICAMPLDMCSFSYLQQFIQEVKASMTSETANAISISHENNSVPFPYVRFLIQKNE